MRAHPSRQQPRIDPTPTTKTALAGLSTNYVDVPYQLNTHSLLRLEKISAVSGLPN